MHSTFQNRFYPFFQDAVCSGTDRVRRNAELGPNDEEVVTEFKPTFMSKGPIIIDEDIIESVGKAEINRLEIDFMTDNGEWPIFFAEKHTRVTNGTLFTQRKSSALEFEVRLNLKASQKSI